MILFPCSGCGQALRVKEDLAGKAARCPRCAQVCVVPAEVPAVGIAAGPAPAKEENQTTVAMEQSLGPTAAMTPPAVHDTHNDEVGDSPAGPAKPCLDFLAPPEAPDEIGRLGPYRVLKVLGAGGMGVVLQAEDVGLKRLVALKVMLPAAGIGTSSARDRFLLEARAAAALDHDHIVTIYQVGEDRGVPFLAMQFLLGESLEQRLQRQGKLPLAEVLRIGREAAQGLAAAHARGLIHRDIKPANIWLDAQHQGRVRLLDFGLARAVSEETHLTQTGVVLGTPAYMAPEQAAGEPMDGRADLFSLGCVLYRMATGRPAFDGQTVISILRAVAFAEPKPLRECDPALPAAFSQLVQRLLAKTPNARPASAEAVAGILQQIQKRLATADPGVKSTPPPVPGPAAAPRAPAAGRSYLKSTPPAPVPVATITPLPERSPAAPTRRKAGPLQDEERTRGKLWPWVLLGGLFLLVVATLATVGLVVLNHQDDPGLSGPVVQGPVAPPVVNPPPPAMPALPLLRLLGGHSKAVWAVAISPDGKRGLSASKDQQVGLWDLHTGALIRSFIGHAGAVTGVVFTPDGKEMLSCGSDKVLRLWDVNTGAQLRQFPGHTGGAWCVALTKDGKRAASGDSSGTVRLWDVATGQELIKWQGHTRAVRVVAFSPDDSLVLSASEDSTLRLWRTDTGQEFRHFLGHQGIVYGAAYAPDGRHVLSGSADGTLRLWDVGTGAEVRRFVGHTNEINGVAFTPDGRHALSGSDDRTVRVWEVATGKQLYQGQGHTGLVFSVAVAPDGRSALSGGFEGRIRLWDLSMLVQQ